MKNLVRNLIGPSAARPFSYRANVAVVTRDGYIEGPTALLEPSPGALRWVLAASPRSPHLADQVSTACRSTARGPKQSDLKEKSKCLCSVSLNTTMEHSAGMNRRVAFEAGFRFSRLDSARDGSAPCRRHLTGLASRLERVHLARTVESFDQRWSLGSLLLRFAWSGRPATLVSHTPDIRLQSSAAYRCSLAEDLAGVLLCEVTKRQGFFAGEN